MTYLTPHSTFTPAGPGFEPRSHWLQFPRLHPACLGGGLELGESFRSSGKAPSWKSRTWRESPLGHGRVMWL